MGICGHRFYFKQELPKVSTIKEKFHEITGLRLQFYSLLNLNELMTDTDDILYYLKARREETNSRVIDHPYFACENFDNIYMAYNSPPEIKSFSIEGWIGMKNMYFWWALIKTMHEIGGHTFRYNTYPYPEDLDVDQYLEPYHPHEREWKQIRKWNEMCDVEKAGFKNKYSES